MIKEENPVKKLRTEVGISQRQLADAVGVNHTLIANIEMNLIEISEDDEELKSKVSLVFDKLAEWSGRPKEELLREQAMCTKEKLISVRELVKQSIHDVCENLIGPEPWHRPEIENLIHEVEKHCLFGENCRSPLKFFRIEGNLTQRQIAQAAEVSQPLIARIEAGELSFKGIRTGHNVLELLLNGFIPDIYSSTYDYDPYYAYDEIENIQNGFIQKNQKKNKNNVEAAFKALRNKQKGEVKIGKDEEPGNLGGEET